MHVILLCAHTLCNKPFPVLPHQAHIWKYCSPACYHTARTTKTHEAFAKRFWSKVTIAGPDECWLWTGALHGQRGYGNFRATPYKAGNVSAHVASWFLREGTWPDDGWFVCHSCDVNACVAPHHLFLGTHVDNMQDMIGKKRQGHITHPESILRGDVHPARLHPERMARGERNGMHTHPETRRRGAMNSNSKLTDAQWAECLELYATGAWTKSMLARRYSITPQAMASRLRIHAASLMHNATREKG